MSIESVEIEGSDIPEALRFALAKVGGKFSVCRVTHANKAVALVSAKWIPLVMRLEAGEFTNTEINQLFDALLLSNGDTETSSAIAIWAATLKM